MPVKKPKAAAAKPKKPVVSNDDDDDDDDNAADGAKQKVKASTPSGAARAAQYQKLSLYEQVTSEARCCWCRCVCVCGCFFVLFLFFFLDEPLERALACE